MHVRRKELVVDSRSPWRPPRWVAQVSGYGWRLLVVVGAAAVVLTLVLVVRPIVLGLLLAILLATLFVPVGGWLRAHRLPPALAAAVSILLLLAVGALAVSIVVRSVVSQWDDLRTTIAAGFERLVEDVGSAVELDAGQQAVVIADGRALWSSVAEVLVGGIATVLPLLVEILTIAGLSVLVLFFLVKDGTDMWGFVLRLAPGQRELVDRLGDDSWATLTAYLRGVAVVAAVDAVAIGLGVWFLGVPFVGAIAVLTFFAAFIPTVGAILSGAVAVLIALADGGWSTAVATLVLVLVVQQIESNVLQPLIVGRATRLHPLAIMLSVTAGAMIGGITGMLLAVPITAVVTTILGDLDRAGVFGSVPAPVGGATSMDGGPRSVEATADAVLDDRR